MDNLIDGVVITRLNQIFDERGKVMHMLSTKSPIYEKFGEIYFSSTHAGVIKAWHMHKEMTLNYVVLKGNIKFVLYDGREDSPTYKEIQEVIIGENQYVMVTVPPFVWNGFKGIGLEEAIVINFTDIPHSAEEIVRMDPHHNDLISYDWSIKDR